MGYIVKKSEKELLVERSVSIQMYFDEVILPSGYYSSDYAVDFDYKPTACCPLHDEDTPSFRYYPDTRSFYCFGCGLGGTVVNLHIDFCKKISDEKVTKEQAIDFLYNYFIGGNKVLPIVAEAKFEVQKKNSDVDLMRFNKYIEDTESALMVDKSTSIEHKTDIWDSIDEATLLVRNDIMHVSDAKSLIESSISSNIGR